eukprot:jgi/Botrbrau1/19795/Bobra.0124s0043.1
MDVSTSEASFEQLGLDARLLRALEKLKYSQPTPVQVECVKAALAGKDIVARARTGSGKTLAYLLPALQRILMQAPECARSSWQALVLVPTRELAEQVAEEARALAVPCGAMIGVTALTADGEAAQRTQLLQAAHLVVATPGRIAQALADGRLRDTLFQPDARQRRAGLSTLILDEADLMLSMPGYDADLAALAPLVPRSCQCMLMSATSSEEVEKLEKLLLHNPVTLSLLTVDAPSGDPGQAPSTPSGTATEISHFYIDCSREERFLLPLVLLKLGLVRRKTLLFVNGAESGYRLRLLLEPFGIRAAVLSGDLPLNSRTHILQEYNRGLFDHLIAVDEASMGAGPAAPAPPEKTGGLPVKAAKKRKRAEALPSDQEFGVVRGIDFKGVGTVLNVEPPSSVAGYVHRVGRTGRAGNSGTAITLLTPADHDLATSLRDALAARPPGVEGSEGEAGGLRPFTKMERRSLEALRYRGEDILRSLNKKVVREARAKDLRLELLNSERLAAHFESHPGDLALLKHDKPLAKAAGGSHLKQLPAYLATASGLGKGASFAPGGKALMWKRRRRAAGAADPLKKGGAFMKAPRKGEAASEPLTVLELEAEKHAPKPKKSFALLPKRNVRKGKYRKR